MIALLGQRLQDAAMHHVVAFAVSLLLAVSLPAGAAAQAVLTVGAASVDITPDPAITNPDTGQGYDGIVDPLFARALVLGFGEERVAVITLDLIKVNEATTERYRSAVTSATGIPASHILINASHTHSAPRPDEPSRASEPEGAREMEDGQGPEALYREWRHRLAEQVASAARKADAARRPASLAIGRSNIGEWLFNRRPVRPDGSVKTTFVPRDPYTLPEGLRFAAVDPTLTVLAFRDTEGRPVASLFHLACHSVSVYPHHKGISADWPGPAVENLRKRTGGEALFLQGCAGDIVPARRGVENAREMGAFIAERTARAAEHAWPLSFERIEVSRAIIGLPLNAAAIERFGRMTVDTEIQVITMGDLALVALPGEPLIGISFAIQEASPFAHTLVLGYSNGRGANYVGMPGDKGRGGYEMGRPGNGTDEAGGFMVATAIRLLQEQHGKRLLRASE